MLGCRKTVAIEKSHKGDERLTSNAFKRIGALIINTLGILPVSRSVYKYDTDVSLLMSLYLSFNSSSIIPRL